MRTVVQSTLLAICMLPSVFALNLIAQQPSRGSSVDVTELPDGIVGQRITQVISAVSSDTELAARMLSIHATGRLKKGKERDTTQFANAFVKSGGLTFYAVRQYENPPNENEFVVIVRKKISDGWMAIVITLEDTPEKRITKLQFAGARPPANASEPTKLSRTEIVGLISQYLDGLEKSNLFSGAILLGQGDDVLVNRAMGMASLRFNVANRPETKFNLASMSKMFTAVAVLKLVEEGKVDLNDTVDQYLSPDWLPAELAEKIQIQHLLTHTSGLGDIFTFEYENTPRNRFRKIRDYRRIFKNAKSNFEPGSRWRYSNAGMFLLGAVVEDVSGDDFFEHVNDLIFVPAGMKNTGYYSADVPVPNVATGYHKRRGVWINNLFMHSVRGSPAGGAVSTTEDLFRFSRAFQKFELLDEVHTKLAMTSKPDLHSDSYGYGFQIRPEHDLNIVGHSGGSEGVGVRLDMVADSGFTVVCLSNTTGFGQLADNAETICQTIRDIIKRFDH